MSPKQKRDAAIKEQQTLVSTARAENRDLTTEEQAQFNTLQGTIDACTKALEQAPGRNGDRGNQDDDPPADNDTQRAIAEERMRISEIEKLCRQFGIPSETYVENGSSIDQVRAAVLKTLENAGHPQAQGRGSDGIDVTDSNEDKFRRAMTDALCMRGGLQIANPAEGANELRGMSLRDLAIEALKGDVKNVSRKSNDEIFNLLCERQYYNPSAAFPAIMDQTINKAYAQGYNEVQTTFELFCRDGSLSDFKTSRHEYLAGPAGEFKRVNENGELTADKPTDSLLPTRKLETYGKQFTMTRQAFINDDIGFITSVPARYARAGKTTINKQVYGVLVGNPSIYDGVALFHASHKNLVSVNANIGAPSSTAIQAMITGLASQINQFNEPIMIRPGYLIVPVGYGFAIQTIFESATISTSGNTQSINPLYQYRSQIKVAEDPTINALATAGSLATVPWFLAADKMDCGGIQVDYLNGQKMPTIRRMEKPGTLGFVWDIYHDWGISVTDFRGLVKNPGAALSLNL